MLRKKKKILGKVGGAIHHPESQLNRSVGSPKTSHFFGQFCSDWPEILTQRSQTSLSLSKFFFQSFSDKSVNRHQRYLLSNLGPLSLLIVESLTLKLHFSSSFKLIHPYFHESKRFLPSFRFSDLKGPISLVDSSS